MSRHELLLTLIAFMLGFDACGALAVLVQHRAARRSIRARREAT